MKIFKVEFMNSGSPVRTEDYASAIGIGLDGFFVKEEDLDGLKKYGGGFKKVEYVGKLFESENNKNIVINVVANLTNKEEIEKIIDELSNKLKNMKIHLSL